MKLYLYDHCPFCVRARMIFPLRRLQVEEIYLPYDDETTPTGFVGAKLLPVLEKPDGTYLGESLEVVRFVDTHVNGGCLDMEVRPQIEFLMDEMAVNEYKLVLPRMVLLGLAEFPNQAAIDYYTVRKEAVIGDFKTNMAQSPVYIAQIEAVLEKLSRLVISSNGMKGYFSLEDILIFPLLRNLTMVRGLVIPKNIKEYILSMSAQTNIPLFWSRAV